MMSVATGSGPSTSYPKRNVHDVSSDAAGNPASVGVLAVVGRSGGVCPAAEQPVSRATAATHRAAGIVLAVPGSYRDGKTAGTEGRLGDLSHVACRRRPLQ